MKVKKGIEGKKTAKVVARSASPKTIDVQKKEVSSTGLAKNAVIQRVKVPTAEGVRRKELRKKSF